MSADAIFLTTVVGIIFGMLVMSAIFASIVSRSNKIREILESSEDKAATLLCGYLDVTPKKKTVSRRQTVNKTSSCRRTAYYGNGIVYNGTRRNMRA